MNADHCLAALGSRRMHLPVCRVGRTSPNPPGDGWAAIRPAVYLRSSACRVRCGGRGGTAMAPNT